MLNPAANGWMVRGATFALWLLVAASAAYWGLRVSSGTAAGAAPPAAVRPAAADPAALARLLGGSAETAAAPAPSLASRFVLHGVVAGVRSGEGAAVIGVDGKPARSYRVGSAIEEGLVLQSVQGRKATLAPSANGAQALVLEVPAAKK